MQLSSPVIAPNREIPTEFTCEGQDISPPLEWKDLPDGTRSLALVVDDPDAPDPSHPQRTFVHWVLYNLPPEAHGLPENAKARELPKGTRQGLNDRKKEGYSGPCPPIGRHRYFIKLYALDAELPDLGAVTKQDLLREMDGHVIEHAQLIGTYEKHVH